MAWDQKIIPDAFLASALAAVNAAVNGGKNNAFMSHIQTGIGTSWKRQLLRDDIVVFEGTGTGLIPYSGTTFTVPGVTKTSITSADIDTGEWVHRVINASDSTKYIANLVTPTGGVGPGFLTGDLVSPNNVTWGAFTMTGPSFDTSSQVWTDLLYNGMKGSGDLFDINSQPGGGSVAANGGPVQFGGSYTRVASTEGVRAAVFAGTGSYAFGNGVTALVPWAWTYAGYGNTDTTAEIECRRMFAQVRRKSTQTWEFMFVGAKMFGHETYNYPGNGGNAGNQVLNYTTNSSKCRPFDGTGYEMWPEPSATNPEVVSFYGAINPTKMQDFDAICVGWQVRMINKDPTKNSIFLANIGWDVFRPGSTPRYDANGYPYEAMDGGGGRWRFIPQNGEWTWITAVSCWELGTLKVSPPPWGNYTTNWPWATGIYGPSWDDIQANPPIDMIAYYNTTTNPGTTKQIQAVGDSLTEGDDDVSGRFRTWRGTFQTLMTNVGISYNMIGPQSKTPASGGTDSEHAAWGGAYISDAGVGAPNASNNLTIRNSTIFASTYQPDIIIIYAGWNDLYNQNTSVASRYETYYNLVRSTRPNAKIVLCTLQPQQGEFQSQTNSSISSYQALNTKIRDLAAANLSTTIVADLAAVNYVSGDYWDSIHMLQSGASKQAQCIFDAIRTKGWF